MRRRFEFRAEKFTRSQIHRPYQRPSPQQNLHVFGWVRTARPGPRNGAPRRNAWISPAIQSRRTELARSVSPGEDTSPRTRRITRLPELRNPPRVQPSTAQTFSQDVGPAPPSDRQVPITWSRHRHHGRHPDAKPRRPLAPPPSSRQCVPYVAE